jgi:putative membrane protein
MKTKGTVRMFAITAATLISAVGLLGQSPNQGQLPAAQLPYPSVGDTMGDAQSRQLDQRFLTQAMQASLLNVAMGKLAADKAGSDPTKKFGLTMDTDNQRAVGIFQRVAAKDGVSVPDKLDAKHQERLDRLAKLSGPEFDRAYVKDQLKAHQQMVALFESEAENSTDTAARKMATAMLPAVFQHLNLAKDLNRSLATVARR